MTTHSTTAEVSIDFANNPKYKKYFVYYGWFTNSWSYCKGAAVLTPKNNNLVYTNRDPNANPKDVWFLFISVDENEEFSPKEYDWNHKLQHGYHIYSNITSYDTLNYVVEFGANEKELDDPPLLDNGWCGFTIEEKFTDADNHEMEEDGSIINVRQNFLQTSHNSTIHLKLVKDNTKTN